MAGTRGGTLLKLLTSLVIFSCVVAAAWIYFLPMVLTSALQKHTGFGVKVTELRFNPFNAKVDLTGLILTNPESFPRREFMEVTSFSANAKLSTLFSNRPEFDYARVEVAYVALVRDADGVLNAQLFNDRLNPPPIDKESAEAKKAAAAAKLEPAKDVSATQGGPVTKPKEDKKPVAKDSKAKMADASGKDKTSNEVPVKPLEKPMRFMIHRLELRLDKMIVADYTSVAPTVHEYNCKLYYTFNDVTDPKQLTAPFALKSLQSVGAAIKALIPGDVGKAVDAATKSEEPLLKPKDAQNEDPLKTVVEKLEETQKP